MPKKALDPSALSCPPLTLILPDAPCAFPTAMPPAPVTVTDPPALIVNWLVAVLELPTPSEFEMVIVDSPTPLPTVTVPTPDARLPSPRFATLTAPPFRTVRDPDPLLPMP